jgi:hypothetical protein
MPRKPKPPMPLLVIQTLSDGINRALVDDFTGELMPQPDARPPVDPMIAVNARKRAHREAAQRVLDVAFAKPKPVELVPKGKRKIGEVGGKAVLITMPKWRRL